jgi:hypothetical protein
MADARELIGFLDDPLEPAAFDDLGPNELQGPGSSREIRCVAAGATAQRARWIDIANPV